MPSTSLNLKRVTSTKSCVYQIDYRINGKRTRELVGSDRPTTELKRGAIQQELLLGQLNLPNSNRESLSRRSLLNEFPGSRKKRVRDGSLSTYRCYSARIFEFFEGYWPFPASRCQTNQTQAPLKVRGRVTRG
jgi:hypothetical protein